MSVKGTSKIYVVVLAYFFLFSPYNALGWVLPSNSLLSQKIHPRLWFIPQSQRDSHPTAPGITASEMRFKLSTYYSTEFQDFIVKMDAHFSDEISIKTKLYLTNDAIGYAFLYMLDPQNMAGFTASHTREEYANKAKTHWVQIGQHVQSEVRNSNTLSAWLDTRYLYTADDTKGGAVGMALAVVYDWLGSSYFNGADKTFLLDVMNKAHELNSSTLMTYTPYLNNSGTALMQNAYYVALALYGDIADVNLLNRFNEIEDIHIRAVRDLSNLVFEGGSNWGEGLSLYFPMSGIHTGLFFGGLSSAMGEDLFKTTSFLSNLPEFLVYNIVPTRVGEGHNWTHFDDDAPQFRLLSSSGIKYLVNMYTGMLDHSSPKAASLLKWLWWDSPWLGIGRSAITTRDAYVVFSFFSGMNHVPSKSPDQLALPLSKKSGGEYIFKSDLTSDDSTHIVFWAPKYMNNRSGHGHFDFSSFLIHKYGNLAIQRSVRKGYTGGNIWQTRRSSFYNTIAVYNPNEVGDFNLMSFRDKGFDVTASSPTDPAFSENGANHVGSVIRSDLNALHYDYVDYDYSNAWDSSKVNYSEREFIYLRSEGGINDEYVVVFDRVNAVDASYTKYFLLHSSNEPKLLNNLNSEITMVAQDYPNDPDGGGGRWVHSSASPLKDNIIELTTSYTNTNGRLYSKTLLPQSFQINKVGGEGHYWEDARGKLIHTKQLTASQKYFRGTYTMQIQSTTGNKYDNFLNVIQLGDSNTLTQMTPTTRIDGNTMVGTLINDPTAPRIVMFSKDPRGTSISSASYTASYPASRTGKHLLVDVTSGLYDIYKAGTKILTNAAVPSNGVLSFDATGGGTFQVVRSGDLPDFPPAPPTGLTIN